MFLFYIFMVVNPSLKLLASKNGVSGLDIERPYKNVCRESKTRYGVQEFWSSQNPSHRRVTKVSPLSDHTDYETAVMVIMLHL